MRRRNRQHDPRILRGRAHLRDPFRRRRHHAGRTGGNSAGRSSPAPQDRVPPAPWFSPPRIRSKRCSNSVPSLAVATRASASICRGASGTSASYSPPHKGEGRPHVVARLGRCGRSAPPARPPHRRAFASVIDSLTLPRSCAVVTVQPSFSCASRSASKVLAGDVGVFHLKPRKGADRLPGHHHIDRDDQAKAPTVIARTCRPVISPMVSLPCR
jgi:hypothetical protein